MKNILIVYYSRSGFTKQLAQELAVHLHADLEEIIDKKDRSGALGYLFSGRDALKEKTTEIQKITRQPDNYQLVVIATPVWAFKCSTPILTFIKKFGQNCGRVAFVATQGSSGADGAFQQMSGQLKQTPIATLIVNSKEISQNKYQDKTKIFANKIKASLNF
ncbi:MAG TPA: flavodoxin [bacterium]|nr:flavodoxin [bacterium]